MASLTALLIYDGDETRVVLADALSRDPAVSGVVLIDTTVGGGRMVPSARSRITVERVEAPLGSGLARILDRISTDYLLLVLPGHEIQLGQRTIERLVSVAEDTGAGLIYSDYRDRCGEEVNDHPLNDYQPGSIRDNFDFGSMVLVSKRAVNLAFDRHGALRSGLRWGGFYDLRLKLSVDSSVLRIPEPLYTRAANRPAADGERQFDYVDPRQRDYQREVEEVATDHLKRVGAYLAPEFDSIPTAESEFPVVASVVIPVRNRERTIEDAVQSALSQRAPFEFNVIVIDNHSTDETTEILVRLAREDVRLVHLKPRRRDLGIGGCWNEAIYSEHCGRYAVQLDSDDLYADDRVLERIIAKFDEGPYAMVIGSYTIVDFSLREIPPGLIDHREWTRENGRNNALRVNGLGAPRAFYVPALRRIGFPNTSYGEDYSVALRISRQYEIGRIFESVYYARRWEGNSDAALPLATANRYDAYKDFLRTVEIPARIRMNRR
ncbi:MAG TPA: glycosyltransferase family 2 protein [Blastocatellia bacterium]|nr:glycosyltransferase family 2 protein [Blastocatellia bacterium]